jgi:hypothetical protein
VATRLLGKPLAQPLLNVVLRERPMLFGVIQPVAHFIEDIEVVLDVLKRAVLREFVKEGFDLLFGGGHYRVRIAWRSRNPGLAKRPGAAPGALYRGRRGGTAILKRAAFGELVEEGFDLLFSGGHRRIRQ